MARMLEVEGLSAGYGHVDVFTPRCLYVDAGACHRTRAQWRRKIDFDPRHYGLIPTEGRIRFFGNTCRAIRPAAALGLVLVPEGRGIFGR